MKKCPFCNSFVNDEEKICPHCQRDISEIEPMSEVAPKNYKKSYYFGVFGLVFAGGGIIASLSQRFNRINNYLPKYNELLEKIKVTPEGDELTKLKNEASAYLTNIKTCQFREIFFYVVAGLGVALIIFAIIIFFKQRRKLKTK